MVVILPELSIGEVGPEPWGILGVVVMSLLGYCYMKLTKL